jgi:hypothetical protein
MLYGEQLLKKSIHGANFPAATAACLRQGDEFQGCCRGWLSKMKKQDNNN